MGTEAKSADGERILPATRRPDGTMRKPVRIRAGYVAQEEVAIYQSKGAQFKKSLPLVPPGYDPETDLVKPKTKAAKKNEKRKEKKLQARLAETDPSVAEVESLRQQIDSLQVASEPSKSSTPSTDTELQPKQIDAEMGGKSEVEKKIRALKKKIRLANEVQQEASSSQQSDKLAKIEAWQNELKLLELEYF